jgi:hypothetical protein
VAELVLFSRTRRDRQSAASVHGPCHVMEIKVCSVGLWHPADTHVARGSGREQRLWYLQRLNVFSGLSVSEVEGLSRALSERPHQRRDLICSGPRLR